MKIYKSNNFYTYRDANEYIMFYLDECPPCKKFCEKLMKNINEKEYENIQIIKMDISQPEILDIF